MHKKLLPDHIESLKKYWRTVNYLTVSQIYLQDNFLLQRPLMAEDIKPRLLGHWGTCPGISFVYTMLNFMQTQDTRNMAYMVGTGHGFPAIQANLFLEKTLEKFYEKASHTPDGIAYMSKQFSWPYGFPSHSSPETPGVILEGGELGYALSTAYGSVLDNPDLITVCLIGDGEAETGPTATAWHLNKFVNPQTNGTVLPILHLNEYKISGPTIFGRMSDEELSHLFKGYGYHPFIVEYDAQNPDKIFDDMYETLSKAFSIIDLHKTTRENTDAPQLPMIILKTPKGWTGTEEFDGKKLEGNYLSHQVILKNVKENPAELKALEKWMRSYGFNELFDQYKGFSKDVLSIVPSDGNQLGVNTHMHASGTGELMLPDIHRHAEDASIPGTVGSSSMRRVGEYLNNVFCLNPKKFRLFSPDETYSNKLDKVFETTHRAFVWPRKATDTHIDPSGKVIEMLSEHSLQGLLQGYILTGRHGIFASYEAFVQIVTSMADQYAKFLKVSAEVPWRNSIPSLNYILTSSGWRQEHNGFSHQNPGFIDDMLQRQGDFVHIFFPPDGNSALACIEEMLQKRDSINVLVAGKTLEPRWLSIEQARQDVKTGVSIWDFASDSDPDIVFASAGDYVTKEMLAAISLLKKEVPTLRIRYVNVMRLDSSGSQTVLCRSNKEQFENYFTPDKPILFNFHGYPQTLKQILFDCVDSTTRFHINGYIENGSTTTPFDMQIRNKTSRYDLIIQAMTMVSDDIIIKERKEAIINAYKRKIKAHREYIIKNGVDPEEIESWIWNQ